MKNYKRLVDYINAMDGEFGCRSKYDDRIVCGNKLPEKYASLAGHYSALLDDALSLVLPAVIEHIVQNNGNMFPDKGDAQ